MKKRIVALLLCCVMLLTLSPNLIATAVADDVAAPTEQVEEEVKEKVDEEKVEEKVEEETPAAETTDETKDEESATPEQPVDPVQPTAPEQPAAPEEPKAEELETKTEEPVESEIVNPTVNYTDVAPFLPPVSGSTMLRARAAANDATGDAGEKDSGMKVSKTATANENGTYTITLEAYATGEQVITEITKDVPTDIILVLDQSGSMAHDIGQVTYTKYEDESDFWGTTYHTRNRDYYDYRHNGGSANLWYKLSDGSYVSVSVTAQETLGYTKITNGLNNSSWYGATNLWNNRNNLFAKVDGQYVKVLVEQVKDGYWNTYTYKLLDGTEIASGGFYNDSPSITGTDDNQLYLGTANDAETVYTYTYTDKAGDVKTIGIASEGASTKPDYTFYRRGVSSSGGGSRLAALKTAVNSFVSAVNAKAKGTDGVLDTKDDINHRIAVVGFASESGYGNNTELLSIAGHNSGTVGVAYNNISTQNLKAVMQSMNTTAGQTMVTNAINALAAEGATRVDLGLDMANRILNANPVQQGETRNRVVIVFTDGAPTTSSGFDKTVATSAINKASSIKSAGATVYSVGIFSGADATSAGTEPSRSLGDGSNAIPAASNWFMQNVSSNNGTPRSPSYYLSAGDAASLNSIFQQISSNITTGGSSTTLDEKTVIKDIISPQFTVPANATDIKVYTAESDGSTAVWKDKVPFSEADVTIDQTMRTISVTKFSFKDNWCGNQTQNGTNTFHDGKKLIIEFTVSPQAGFLGGNNVPTNADAGVYPNANAREPVVSFPQPTVNVPIKDVMVTAQDKNVYLLGTVTADDLKRGATVKVGDVELKLGEVEVNYGLEDWQTEYVTIDVKVMDKNGNEVSSAGLTNLTDDTTYTIAVTVKPKYEGTVIAKDGTDEADINVFKPELTFQDSEAYYGDDAPNYSTTNKVGEVVWKHGKTTSTDEAVTMLVGTAPELDITYTTEADKIVDGKINTKQDIPVAVSVNIGETDVNSYTTFVHQACNPACGWNVTEPLNGNPAFLLHVQTCKLTITKTGGADGEPYVFTVKKDGKKYTEVTIVGNDSVTIYELPVGTYTIEEDTGWSWRYSSPQYSINGAALSANNSASTIICTNTREDNKWLNGFSAVVENIFGAKH